MPPSPKKAKTEEDELSSFIDATNADYEGLHRSYEEQVRIIIFLMVGSDFYVRATPFLSVLLPAQFWGTKMDLGGGLYSTEKLTSTLEAMEAFLRDEPRLAKAEALLASGKGSETQKKTLTCFVKTFKCYQVPAGVERRSCFAGETAYFAPLQASSVPSSRLTPPPLPCGAAACF